MNNEKAEQDARAEFYGRSSVAKYLKTVGIPTRTGQFRDMVASGSDMDLQSKEGLALVETLGRVVFAKHPQQINVTDKTTGSIIASIQT
jgi:hypothetical protein